MDSDRDVCTRAHWFLSCSHRTGTIRRSLSRKVAMRDTSTSRAPSVFVLSGAISRVLISTISTAAAMAGGVAGNANDTFRTTVHERRDRTSLLTVAGAHSGVALDLSPRWKAHATPSGTLGKAEANGVVCLPDSQTCSVSCGNLVAVAKVFFVVQLLNNGGRVVQKSHCDGFVMC